MDFSSGAHMNGDGAQQRVSRTVRTGRCQEKQERQTGVPRGGSLRIAVGADAGRVPRTCARAIYTTMLQAILTSVSFTRPDEVFKSAQGPSVWTSYLPSSSRTPG